MKQYQVKITGAAIIIIFAVLAVWNSPYLGWNYSNPEIAIVGVLFHIFEWLFARTAPLVFIAAIDLPNCHYKSVLSVYSKK